VVFVLGTAVAAALFAVEEALAGGLTAVFTGAAPALGLVGAAETAADLGDFEDF